MTSPIALIERLNGEMPTMVVGKGRHGDTIIDLDMDAVQLEREQAATELTTLLQRVESAEESAVEASIRAHAWMEAHDKLQAGKSYKFPSPADKPALLQRAEKAEAQWEHWKTAALKSFFDEEETKRVLEELNGTLLQRAEKAEADLINYKLDYLRISHDRIEYRKALQAVDATAAFNTDLGKYMIEPHALDMVSNAIRAGGKQE